MAIIPYLYNNLTFDSDFSRIGINIYLLIDHMQQDVKQYI